jgi:hypothetical protein
MFMPDNPEGTEFHLAVDIFQVLLVSPNNVLLKFELVNPSTFCGAERLYLPKSCVWLIVAAYEPIFPEVITGLSAQYKTLSVLISRKPP